jgi:hypothetical protein
MKKAIFMVLFCVVSLAVMAQTGGVVEVRGVETRWEKYDLDEPIYSPRGKKDQRFAYGITFTNKNNFSVTIEAELYQEQYKMDNSYTIVPEKLVNTKSFVLDIGEEYTWKLEFNSYSVQKGAYNDRGHYHDRSHYVKYKSFKNL